jgi:pullulanase
MHKLHKTLVMGITAIAALSCCSPKTASPVPQTPLEECVYSQARTDFSVWAPDAQAARLRLYNSASDQTPCQTFDMKSGKDGLWTVAVKGDIKGTFYTFQVCRNGEWLDETAGIAAKAVGVNGWRGAVVDWDETDPEGWADDKSPEIRPSDIIVYELQHRDFSIHENSGVTNKGKFLAQRKEQGTLTALPPESTISRNWV